MSTMVEFSDSDLLRNKQVEPAWYRLNIKTVGEWSPSKDGKSENLKIETEIVANAENGSEDFKGVPIEILFNSNPKVKSFIEGFLRALKVDVTAGRFDLKSAEGMQIDAYIKNEPYEGRILNKINHQYRTPRA